MELRDYIDKFEYDFGSVYFYENYAVGNFNAQKEFDKTTAKTILNAINTYYVNRKIVYISNRQFVYNVDPTFYKLIDSKKIIGIAVVALGEQQRVQASSEQAAYKGSFGFFNNIDSAISWAESFVNSKASR